MDKTEIYASKEYKRSRNSYIWQSAFEWYVMILYQAPFITLLFTNLGMSDSIVGIISYIASLTVVFQLLSVLVVRRISNTKTFSIFFHGLSRVFFVMLYLIPLLPIDRSKQQILAIMCLIGGYFGYQFVASVVFRWGNSFVEDTGRAVFSAKKEKISMITGIVLTLGAGYLIDYFEMNDQIDGGFLFVSVAIMIFSMCDLICMLLIQKENSFDGACQVDRTPVKVVWENTVKKKEYQQLIVLTVLFSMGQIVAGFLGTYELKELGYSIGTIQLMSVFGILVRFFISTAIGKYSDRHSYIDGMKLGMLLLTAAYIFLIFTMPKTRFLIIVYILLEHASIAGYNANSYNVVYDVVDKKYFSEAFAIKMAISVVVSFLLSLGAGALLDMVQKNGNCVIGVPIYGQQILAIISCTFMLSAILYVQFVIKKNPRYQRKQQK